MRYYAADEREQRVFAFPSRYQRRLHLLNRSLRLHAVVAWTLPSWKRRAAVVVQPATTMSRK